PEESDDEDESGDKDTDEDTDKDESGDKDKEESGASDDGDESEGGGTLNPEMSEAVDDIEAALQKLAKARSDGDFEAGGKAKAELQEAAKRFKEAQSESSGG
ncbi:MAG TPA: hypothetical protein VK078_02385, partial [Pseudogracilibacillus sp.]|nr:hypothetical protein [Pseudogracilibacillus sp.]